MINASAHRSLTSRYSGSLSLLTDLYQITMAAAGSGAGASGVGDRHAVFHLSFRTLPFKGGYAIVSGVQDAVDWLTTARFTADDRAYLASLRASDGSPLLPTSWVERLERFRFTLDVDAMPEGSTVFPHESIMRVAGPLLQCQLAETALLTLVNFQTLVATKAARVCDAAGVFDGSGSVIDFGLRRAQGIDGAISATRAAYVGGVEATSNVLAGKLLGIPVRGTHAHSWVMAFDDEHEAFERYARAMPSNVVLLVDTYDTIEGVKNAIRVALDMRSRGQRLLGVRLDSGDLAYLSTRARAMLDEAGLHDAKIVASNDLDEHIISSLRQQGAKIDVWGVGTKLVTAYDQPALGGVYKLGAIADDRGVLRPRIKLSSNGAKTSIPGVLSVARFSDGERDVCDAIVDADSSAEVREIVDPADPTRRRSVVGFSRREVLVPMLRAGDAPASSPDTLEQARARARASLLRLDPAVRRLLNPHEYPAGLEAGLYARRAAMIAEARGKTLAGMENRS